MKTLALLALLAAASICSATSAAESEFIGDWNVVITHGDETSAMQLHLNQEGEALKGESKSRDSGFGLSHAGTLKGKRAHLTASAQDYAKLIGAPPAVGTIDLEVIKGKLVGKGTLFGTAVALSGTRPEETKQEPQTHEYSPNQYITTLSGKHEPVLHIRPGDSVRTTTVDANGLDHQREWRSIPATRIRGLSISTARCQGTRS